MNVLPLVLDVFAFVLFVLAAWAWASLEPHRLRLVAAGLAFWMASVLFAGVLK